MGVSNLKLRRLCLGACIFFAAALCGYADTAFALRLAPGMSFPLMSENRYSLGYGVSAGLDWLGLSGFGLSAGGSFSSLGVQDGTRSAFIEGWLGPVWHKRLSDRFAIQPGIKVGVYHQTWEDESLTKLRAGLDVTGFYHFSPTVSLSLTGGYTWYNAPTALHGLRLGVGIRLNMSELFTPQTRINGEKTGQLPVFPVSYAWYEDNAVAMVRITNNEPNTINALNLSFFLEQYMNQPTVFGSLASLKPGESAEFPVTALFNESMLDLTENMNANAFVQIDYRSLGSGRHTEFPVQMPVYHRNAMNWDDDRRAASFVSARDPAAVLFAKYTASVMRDRLKPGIPENMQYALALFEALNLYGISYIIDPASSYIAMSEDASALDSLNYPYQTLFYRGGDCDDLSILFCSLLEVLGIESAFVTVPGHIYIAFDSGMDPSAGLGNFANAGLIPHGDKLWMPLEITVPRMGFTQAVKIGAREWSGTAARIAANAESGGEGAIFPMRDSWLIYPPVSVPGAGDRLPSLPDEEALIRVIENELNRLRF
jgi:hypothetical protein